MRRLALPCLLATLPLGAQTAAVSLLRQARATAVEATLPVADTSVVTRGHEVYLHLGLGAGFRRWDDGQGAARLLLDTHAFLDETYVGFGTVLEAPAGERPFLGPRLRVGWAFHPAWALSLEGEHLERIAPARQAEPQRRSGLALVLSTRF